MILAHFDKTLKKLHVFYRILGPFFCAKCSVRKFGCAKELTFRRSGYPQPTLVGFVLRYGLPFLSPWPSRVKERDNK